MQVNKCVSTSTRCVSFPGCVSQEKACVQEPHLNYNISGDKHSQACILFLIIVTTKGEERGKLNLN